jgi:hypothetical protein
MNASPFGHDSYRLGTGIPATAGPLRSCMRYIHDPQELFKCPLSFRQGAGCFEEDAAVHAHIETEANSNLDGWVSTQMLACDF